MKFGLAELPIPMAYATHRIIRDCNEAFANLFELTREQVVDGSFARLYPALSDFVRTGETWSVNLAGSQVYHDQRVMKTANGRRFWCEVNGRSRTPQDPFAEAIYSFQPIARPVRDEHTLTDRRRQVLALVAQGKKNSDIALELGLSRRTVEAHRARLMRQVGVRNTAELVAWFSSQTEQHHGRWNSTTESAALLT